MRRIAVLVQVSFSAVAALGVLACGGAQRPAAGSAATAPKAASIRRDDQSRCDFKGRADREAVESTSPGSTLPNVRRVFGVLGEGDDRRRVLFCREVDTNLDGVKDVVRTYNDKGDAVDEQADTNYDGRVDTWIRFAGGRIAKEEIDTNHDGKPDETRYYVKGKLSRAQRDTNSDGRPDVWEVYADGALERMGTDLDFDGHVNRWDRDEVAHRIADQKEREEEEKAEAQKKAAAEAEGTKLEGGPVRRGGKASKPDDKTAKPDDKAGKADEANGKASKPADKAGKPVDAAAQPGPKGSPGPTGNAP